MFSQFSVRKPYTIVVAVIIIAILGGVSLINMSVNLFPSINIPYAVVSTTYIGASPEEVEMMVTRPMEQSMASVGNVKSVRSISREHSSIIILEFSETTNMDSAIIEMRESLDMIKGFLPSGVGSPIILKLNPDMMPVMVVSASVKDTSIKESSQYLEHTIIPQLESVSGVASVSASGLIDNQIHVVIRQEKVDEINASVKEAIMASMLAQRQEMSQMPLQGQFQPPMDINQPPTPAFDIPEIAITKEMISGILKGQNFSMPAGYITEEGVDYLVRAGDKIKDVEELETLTVMVLPFEGMEPIQLKDVAEIITLDNSGEKYTKVNGNDAIILTIQKQTEFATSDVADNIRSRINDITQRDEGIEIIALMDQGEYIDIVVNSISKNLIYGGILAVLILLIFLRDLKPTFVVGFAIPVSLVTAFVMMYFSNITLNIVSMGGLALGVGMLVDNSIVVIENIYRMREEGRPSKEAAIEGAKEVSGAITASTLTTISVFAPILFTHGITRQLFADMGLTIAYSLVASLIIALTLVPMLASNMMVKNTKKEHRVLDWIKSHYVTLLRYSLKRKAFVVIIALVLFVASIVGAFRIGTEFFPASDTGQLQVTLAMEKGTAFEDTVAASDKLVERILGIEEVEIISASMSGGMFGMGFGRGGNSDSVSINILLKENRELTTNEVAQQIRDLSTDIEGEVTVSGSNMDMTAMSGGAVSISISGSEFETLEMVATDIAKLVAEVEGTVEISDGLEKTSPELRIVVDKDKSIAYGLTVAQVFMEVNNQLKEDSAVTNITIGANVFDIFVKDEASDAELDRRDIENIIIPSPQGEGVALKDIANVVEATGFSSINRLNQQRYVTVTAEIAEGYNIGLVNREIDDKLMEYKAPEGYLINSGGQNQMIRDSFKDLFLMLALAVIFIYLIMVAQFQSLLSPFIVMFTIPLAFTGGFFGLMITGKPVSIVAFIGLIILSGVVVNNGIVFVDYINILRRKGMSKKDAIVEAGVTRLRPIVMTALTTIIALSTMSFGVGMGTEMIQPMAITAIGGLIYATLITLLLIPTLYDILNRKDIILSKEEL